jgi:hypothetical protein
MPGNRKTKQQIDKMRNTYFRCGSLAMTARECGCTAATVRRYRDNEGWDRPAKIPTGQTLTTNIAMKLAVGWKYQIKDSSLAIIVGVTKNQLRLWLEDNVEATITVTQTAEDGTKIKTEQQIGLRDLRERERHTTKLDYIQRYVRLIDKAIEQGKLETARKGYEWIMSKLFPKDFGWLSEGRGGRTQIDIIEPEQVTIIKQEAEAIAQMGFTDEELKVLAKAARRRKAKHIESRVVE